MAHFTTSEDPKQTTYKSGILHGLQDWKKFEQFRRFLAMKIEVPFVAKLFTTLPTKAYMIIRMDHYIFIKLYYTSCYPYMFRNIKILTNS